MRRIISAIFALLMTLTVFITLGIGSGASADAVHSPYISSYGVTLTVHGLHGAKDLFIAEGEYHSYRELKDNGYTVCATSRKFTSEYSYCYTLKDPGIHTVIIRYNDGTQSILHETLRADEPIFTENGLQLIISNIPDVRVIRTAYGEWNTVKELKATDTIRNFSAKTAIKGKDPYTVQYRTEGRVTVTVEYNNGYLKVYHYDVCKKSPEVTQKGNTVTFSALEGLRLIRYAEGEYTAAADIKASGSSRVKRAADAVDGRISVTLPDGTYTFCVQYDDESYNFYTLSIKEEEAPSDRFTKEIWYSEGTAGKAASLPYWLYTPAETDGKMPLIVVLHSALSKAGAGYSTEENLENMVSKNNDIPRFIYNGDMGDIPAYIIMPQTDSSSRGWAKRGKELSELIEHCIRELNIDEDAVSLIGYSLGGTGAVELAAAYPELFDRVVSIGGGLDGVTNNTRPYIQNKGRLELGEDLYPELRALNINGTAYEKETMKYLYAPEDGRYHTASREEKQAAHSFKAERIASVAEALLSNNVSLWMITAENDAETAPSVYSELYDAVGEGNSRLDVIPDCGHSAVLNEVLYNTEEILDFITGKRN